MTAPGLTVIWCSHTRQSLLPPGSASGPAARRPRLLAGAVLCRARGVCGPVGSAGDGPCMRTLHNGLFASSVSLKTLPARG